MSALDPAVLAELAALVDNRDVRAARRRVNQLQRTLDAEQLSVVWTCVEIWERKPYLDAKQELRELWAANPAHQALIEQLVPDTDPGIYRPANDTTAAPPTSGTRSVRAPEPSRNRPRSLRRRVEKSLRTGPTRPDSRAEHEELARYFGDDADDERARATALRRQYATDPGTDIGPMADLDTIDAIPEARAHVDDDKPWRRDSRTPFARMDVEHDHGYDADPEEQVWRDIDKEDTAPDLRGLPCVSCRIERAVIDATGSTHGLPYTEPIRSGGSDDGLCGTCRMDRIPGIPALPTQHRRADATYARCDYIAQHHPTAARAILRQEWRLAGAAGNPGMQREIQTWINGHPELPATPKRPAHQPALAAARLQPTASDTNGWCSTCNDFAQLDNDLCTDCRPTPITKPPEPAANAGNHTRENQPPTPITARTPQSITPNQPPVARADPSARTSGWRQPADTTTNAARIVTALLESGDIEAAKRCRRELVDIATDEELAIIGRSLATWEHHPYNIAIEKHREFWKQSPEHHALIEALIPPQDPQVHSPTATPRTPPGLQPLGIDTIRTRRQLHDLIADGAQPTYLAFSGHRGEPDGQIGRGALSQWWPAAFTIGGTHYPTAEHWMMTAKAHLMGDPATAEQILKSGHPANAKTLGRRVRNFNQTHWEAVRYDIAVTGNYAKFTQNPQLAEYLLSTGNHILVEASPWDHNWGIGISATDPRTQNPHHWRGDNLLGFALMEVRTRLKTRTAEPILVDDNATLTLTTGNPSHRTQASSSSAPHDEPGQTAGSHTDEQPSTTTLSTNTRTGIPIRSNRRRPTTIASQRRRPHL